MPFFLNLTAFEISEVAIIQPPREVLTGIFIKNLGKSRPFIKNVYNIVLEYYIYSIITPQ